MLQAVNGCFDKSEEGQCQHPVNWEFIGMVYTPDSELPTFIEIGGVVYKRERT